MNQAVVDTALLSTPFVASWFGRARPGDLYDPDPARRSAAWAHWALTSMTSRTGRGQRPYIALELPGSFYDPRRSTPGPEARPHLEVPTWKFERPDVQFPDRLALAGNAVQFSWWIPPEALAAKRAILVRNGGDIGPLAELLWTSRVGLIDALNLLNTTARAGWATLEALQVSDPVALSASAVEPFTRQQVADFLPGAAALGLTCSFEPQLAATAAGYASRRLGVWRLQGADDAFSLGVLTPRLTRSSLFVDQLFAPTGESAAALLVRGLLLRRLLSVHLGAQVGPAVADAPATSTATARLRAVVARVGEKLPEASVPSAVNFLQNYPDAANAWAALSTWADSPVEASAGGGTRATLTVSADRFYQAHRAALRALHRAEDPAREDIDVILPLAWDHRRRVVRVTFARPAEEVPAPSGD